MSRSDQPEQLSDGLRQLLGQQPQGLLAGRAGDRPACRGRRPAMGETITSSVPNSAASAVTPAATDSGVPTNQLRAKSSAACWAAAGSGSASASSTSSWAARVWPLRSRHIDRRWASVSRSASSWRGRHRRVDHGDGRRLGGLRRRLELAAVALAGPSGSARRRSGARTRTAVRARRRDRRSTSTSRAATPSVRSAPRAWPQGVGTPAEGELDTLGLHHQRQGREIIGEGVDLVLAAAFAACGW